MAPAATQSSLLPLILSSSDPSEFRSILLMQIDFLTMSRLTASKAFLTHTYSRQWKLCTCSINWRGVFIWRWYLIQYSGQWHNLQRQRQIGSPSTNQGFLNPLVSHALSSTHWSIFSPFGTPHSGHSFILLVPPDQAIPFISGVHNKGQAQAEYIQLCA